MGLKRAAHQTAHIEMRVLREYSVKDGVGSLTEERNDEENEE